MSVLVFGCATLGYYFRGLLFASTDYKTESTICFMIERFLGVVIFVAGDANSIKIGSETNIQDHSLVTVGGSRFSGGNAPTVIGNKVTIGE